MLFCIIPQKLRTHWAGIKEHVASFDELDMSTTRLRLRLPDEPVPDTPQLNVLERSEVFVETMIVLPMFRETFINSNECFGKSFVCILQPFSRAFFLSPRFCKFESDTAFDSLNHMVQPIRGCFTFKCF